MWFLAESGDRDSIPHRGGGRYNCPHPANFSPRRPMDTTTPKLAPPARPRRRSFLFGAAGLLGGAAGVAAAKAPGWRWNPPAGPPELPEGTKFSYAQFGEDLVAAGLFHALGIDKPTFLDIGAYKPIKSNNTYLFYERGARGVLVEPNVGLSDELRRARPGDTLLVAGVGVTDATEADYYVMSYDELSTFSKEQAERLTATSDQTIVEVVKMPLLSLNRVIADHFAGAAPDFLSIDIEGLDFAVLKTLDFDRFRPKVICAETVLTGTLAHNPDTPKLLAEKGYELRGMTHPNVLFVDKRLLGRA